VCNGRMGWEFWVGYIETLVLEARSLFRKLGAISRPVRVDGHERIIRAWSCWVSGFGVVLERVMTLWLLLPSIDVEDLSL
jgi:hypothetical protein